MERRALVAVILSMLVLLLWGYYEQKNVKEKQALQKQLAMETERQEVSAVQPEPARPGRAADGKQVEIKSLTDKPYYKGGELPQVKDVVVETDLATITFTTLGGRLKSYLLKKYKNKDGGRLEMIPKLGYRDMPLALDLNQESGKLITTGGEELNTNLFNKRLNGAVYEANVESLSLHDRRDNGKLTMSYHDGSGVKVVKEFTFHKDKYSFGTNIRIEGLTGNLQGVPYSLTWGSAITEEKKRKGRRVGIQTIAYDGKDTTKYKPRKFKDNLVVTEPIKWVAISTKYFAVAMLPDNEAAPAVLHRKNGDKIAMGLERHISGDSAASGTELYIGPKESKRLESYGVTLEKVIDYRWTPFGETVTRWLAKVLLAVLNWFDSFTHNYGLAIILLTVVIKAAFYPLTEKSFVAMQRMQGLQPKIKELQKRYRNDKQRLNQEMMHLYRTHKANPMGGCLPMLAQLPIFYALYMALLYSIELRQAPFVWWIKDLSEYDPYFITPIIMGVTMFFQQKMSPVMGDPRQAKMMLMMPVIFTMMFIYFPVGLVIYWMINNLLTIAQQYFIKRKMTVAPAKS